MSEEVRYPKRLIEVDLPIKKISAHARREKSIRHGHISTLHIWWARRPLAACRAVICASLWPDPAPEPSDPPCPDKFRQDAVTILSRFQESKDPLGLKDQEEEWDLENPLGLRNALLDFIADFANWDNSAKKEYLEAARNLTQSAHEALWGLPGTRPMLVDPFAGGGAIPLEALRVGADAFASDLNPVAVLLNKVVLEYIPKYGQQLADEVRRWGNWIKTEAEKELAEFYPKDPDGATPIAYLRARTITCEGPGCGAEVPLMRSMWLSKRKNHQVALRMIPNTFEKSVDFEIVEDVRAKDVGEGTVRRGSTTCPVCGYTTPVTSVRRQLKQRSGGAADARLFTVVITRPGQRGRFYRLPNEQDLDAAHKAAKELDQRKRNHNGPLSLVPDEPTPQGGGSGAGRAFSQRNYGMDNFEDLFTPRQALALTTLARLVRETGDKLVAEHENGLATAVQTCLAIMLDKQADYNSSLCTWNTRGEYIGHTFGRQALPMVWDFVELQPFANGSGNIKGALDWIFRVIEQESKSEIKQICRPEKNNAPSHPLPDEFAQCFFTDPPYYDAIPYADLSDFFYVWLKRTLPSSVSGQFTDLLTPKGNECIVDEVKGKDNAYFESAMTQALAEGRRVLVPEGLGVVVFAHKSTGGWEAMIQALLDAGWVITASWPIDTEMGTRLRAMNSAALASSIHLICRPRENPDGSLRTDIGDWRDVLAALPERIHNWLPRLEKEGIVGADAIFSCLGPALEIFSRYSKVEKASGEVVPLREYLEHVWAAVAREALTMIFEGANATGLEEDARLTAMWLWTLPRGVNGNGKARSTEESGKTVKGEFVLEYDAARKIAQGLGIHMEKLGSVVKIKGDKARLLPVEERAQHLFGKEGEQVKRSRKKRDVQQVIVDGKIKQPDVEATEFDEINMPLKGETVLDQVHQAMILFAEGRGDVLKSFLVDEGVGSDQRFWQLAQALSALYPKNTDEKRWVDGLLAKKKGMGF